MCFPRHRSIVLLTICAMGLFACAMPNPRSQEPVPTPTAPLARSLARPEWRTGDRWTYEWTSGRDKGTKTVEVIAVSAVRGVSYYVARIGDLEHYYTHDLHWAFHVKDSRVEARMTPPQPYFVWPLETGRRWQHRGNFDTQNGSKAYSTAFVVSGAETIAVPAGSFEALKVVRGEGDLVDFDEYWYVPQVRYYARWRGRRGDVNFEELLREYIPAPRSSSDPSAEPPSVPR